MIAVKYIPSTYVLDDALTTIDRLLTGRDKISLFLKCLHDNVDIEPPCCTTPDSDGLWSCMCQGRYSVHCWDCQNEDMSEEDAERILTQYEL